MKKEAENLYMAVLSIKNLAEAKRFFRDLLTAEEISEFSKRWQAAQMLYDKIPYSKIEKKTKLSSRTIARIAKWLNKGMGGYKLILKRTHKRNSFLAGKGLC